MTDRNKPKPDYRLGTMSTILELRFGDKWRSAFPLTSGIPKPTVYSVFAGNRALTDEFYARLLKAIDVEIAAMAENVKKAKAIRRDLK